MHCVWLMWWDAVQAVSASGAEEGLAGQILGNKDLTVPWTIPLIIGCCISYDFGRLRLSLQVAS